MSKQEFDQEERSILVVNMRDLKLEGLHELINSDNDKIILSSGERSVSLDMNNTFDVTLLERFGEFAKIITAKTPISDGIGKNERIFSSSDADFIISTIESQQNEYNPKKHARIDRDRNSRQEHVLARKAQPPTPVTPDPKTPGIPDSGTPPKTPDNPDRPDPSTPDAPKKPKVPRKDESRGR